ncbi:MAG: carbon-nitrogen hydrolase family protein [Zoogloeaceae bacterium]|jgi:nitrilase|nr:carbon-nitrogen hydrolase family protein [Zoogloeaceae bacterium]
MKNTLLRVAGAQMVSTRSVTENLVTAERLIAEAAQEGAQLAALPEFFPVFGAGNKRLIAAAETFGAGRIQDWARTTARRHGIWLIAGSLPLVGDTPTHIRNSALAFDPAGECVARYDKIHLFAFARGVEHYDEAETIQPGEFPVAFATPFGRVGLAICYDLRFPELFRALEQPDLIVLPAAFTETTGRAHWEILLRARAIENQCWLLAVDQGGQHANRQHTHGNSMVIDPWGEIRARRDKGTGLIMADLDPAHLVAARSALPALEHRRL